MRMRTILKMGHETSTGFEHQIEMAWATHEAFRRLGFAADDIFVLTTTHDEVYVQLRTQGKEFNVRIDLLGQGMTHEQFNERWLAFIERANGGHFSNDLLQQVFDRWLSSAGGGVPLLTAIVSKGIVLPTGRQRLAWAN